MPSNDFESAKGKFKKKKTRYCDVKGIHELPVFHISFVLSSFFEESCKEKRVTEFKMEVFHEVLFLGKGTMACMVKGFIKCVRLLSDEPRWCLFLAFIMFFQSRQFILRNSCIVTVHQIYFYKVAFSCKRYQSFAVM